MARKALGHPGFVTNPYPLFTSDRQALLSGPNTNQVLTRYDDINTLLRDPRFKKDPLFSERMPASVRGHEGDDDYRGEVISPSMLFLDPPQHTRVRAAFSQAFTPGSLASLRPRIELICRKRLDRVETAGQMDLIRDLAYPLPVIVIAGMELPTRGL